MKTKARDLAEIAADIRSRIETVGDIIAIGGLLREAKCQLRHGKFLPWLVAEFDFSERTAQNYMRAHKFATKNATVADLKLTPTALYFLTEGHNSFSEETSRVHRVDYTADEVALVLKEAAEKRVTHERAEEIIVAERERKKAEQGSEQAPEETEAEAPAAESEDEADAERAEADAILDRGSEVPPPAEPSAPPPSPLDAAILTTFEQAIKDLRSVMTKPASQFKPSYFSAADLQTIAEFLQRVAATKGTAV